MISGTILRVTLERQLTCCTLSVPVPCPVIYLASAWVSYQQLLVRNCPQRHINEVKLFREHEAKVHKAGWAPHPPLTATSTDCIERSQGGFRALGLVAYQKVVSAAKAPKPMSVLVGSVRTYCRMSISSGIRKYRNNSWTSMVLCW